VFFLAVLARYERTTSIRVWLFWGLLRTVFFPGDHRRPPRRVPDGIGSYVCVLGGDPDWIAQAERWLSTFRAARPAAPTSVTATPG